MATAASEHATPFKISDSRERYGRAAMLRNTTSLQRAKVMYHFPARSSEPLKPMAAAGTSFEHAKSTQQAAYMFAMAADCGRRLPTWKNNAARMRWMIAKTSDVVGTTDNMGLLLYSGE